MHCSYARDNILCRVEAQLAPCNYEYAEVMNDILTGVLNQKCQLGGFVKLENKYVSKLIHAEKCTNQIV